MNWVFLVGAAACLTACDTTHIDRVPSAAEERQFATLFPYYMELCALSEFRKKPGSGVDLRSGVGGHALLYLNGVCRDESAHYPTIKLCGAGTPSVERGVGLSVNSHYMNANWIATDGPEFLFHGTWKPGERLTRRVYEETLARAKEIGILDGVVFHPEVFDDKPAQMSRLDYMYEVSVATDFAVAFGRDRYCGRVPITRARMAEVVDFLNDVNAPYKEGRRVFDWSVLNNNCSHLAHNALAVAGIWDTWETERFFLVAAFDFPVPKNEFVDLMLRTNDMPLDDPVALYEDDAARHALLESLPLPTRPGAIAEAEPAIQENDVYETKLSLIFYDDPVFFGHFQQRFDRIFADPRYFDLRANLEYFARLYEKLATTLPGGDGSTRLDSDDDVARFSAIYREYVRRQLSAVDADLSLLDSVPVSAPGKEETRMRLAAPRRRSGAGDGRGDLAR
jgi:hypothetical protein